MLLLPNLDSIKSEKREIPKKNQKGTFLSREIIRRTIHRLIPRHCSVVVRLVRNPHEKPRSVSGRGVGLAKELQRSYKPSYQKMQVKTTTQNMTRSTRHSSPHDNKTQKERKRSYRFTAISSEEEKAYSCYLVFDAKKRNEGVETRSGRRRMRKRIRSREEY